MNPKGYSVEQGTADLQVIDKVNPSKAYAAGFPSLVGPVVDDAGNAPYHFSVLVGQEILGFAELESRVFVLAQRMEFISVQVGSIVFIAPI